MRACAIKQAWTGESFLYQGAVRGSCRRRCRSRGRRYGWAVRHRGGAPGGADRRSFYTAEAPLYETYFGRSDQAWERSKSLPGHSAPAFSSLPTNPDREWETMGSYIAHEGPLYSEWSNSATPSRTSFQPPDLAV